MKNMEEIVRFEEISKACEEARNAEIALENAKAHAHEEPKAFVEALEKAERVFRETEKVITEIAVDAILTQRLHDNVMCDFIVGVNWEPRNGGYDLLRNIELQLMRQGEYDPISNFNQYSVEKEGKILYHFVIHFGDFYTGDVKYSSPEELEAEASEFSEWAEKFARELVFSDKKGTGEFRMSSELPKHPVYSQSVFYALIKAIREIDDYLRISWLYVYSLEKYIVVELNRL